ncbi:hypothetical protein IAU59_007542 [Kwoniella sp. CBS 9459]
MPKDMRGSDRSGKCVRCNLQYADLLDHIKKKHRVDRFTSRDISNTGLIVCPCGRVVLNLDGLNKHRLRFNCTEYTPAPRRSLAREPSIQTARWSQAFSLSSPLSSAPSTSGSSKQLQLSTPLSSVPPPTSPLTSVPSASPVASGSRISCPATPRRLLSPISLGIDRLLLNSPARRSSSRLSTQPSPVYVYDAGQGDEPMEVDGDIPEDEEEAEEIDGSGDESEDPEDVYQESDSSVESVCRGPQMQLSLFWDTAQ